MLFRKFTSTLLLGLISIIGYSQSEEKLADQRARIICGSYYLTEVQEENFLFDFPEGEAIANIILKSFRENLFIPELNTSSLAPEDKVKIESLIAKLNIIKATPPSWEEIKNLEKSRLIRWDKAVRKKSIYKSY